MGPATIEAPQAPVAAPSAQALLDIVIVYGSQTGNSEGMAHKAAVMARAQGHTVEVKSCEEVDPASLAGIDWLILISSTYDDGDFPYNAMDLWDDLEVSEVSLARVHYGVLALGDSNYDDFCGAGRRFDARLAELGATPVVSRADCDLDFEADAEAWIECALAAFTATARGDELPAAEMPIAMADHSKPITTDDPASGQWTRRNPFRATVRSHRVLSGPGSSKSVHHYELDLLGSDLDYRPGDSLSVVPTNDPRLVDDVLRVIGASHDGGVDGESVPLGALLTERLELRLPCRDLVHDVASRTQDPELLALCAGGDRRALDAWMYGRDVLDILNLAPQGSYTTETLLPLLRPIQHRTYSISSSQTVHPDSVHLTVAKVAYDARGRQYRGVASHHLKDCGDLAQGVDVFLTPTTDFLLPAQDVPIIMVGPGTGVAPFRAFLQERQAQGATGGSWLFFGDRNRQHDFLYQEEFDRHLADGTLSRLDLAFSRDPDGACYVQHRMLEAGREVFDWLEQGARLYVCGDADRMAVDVDSALMEIIQRHGGLGAEDAKTYLATMKTRGCYLRDVY
ncbi:sulfite reductase flavoprotein subunit alpha [Okibacterium endophyticum]